MSQQKAEPKKKAKAQGQKPPEKAKKTAQVPEKTKEKAGPPVAGTKPDKQKPKGKGQGKGAGRPAWIPDLEKITGLATQGLLDKEIAALCLIDYRTFSEKKNVFPELQEALDLGRAKGIAAASQKLLAMGLAGDVKCLLFYLERIGKRHKTINLETPKKPIHEMSEAELNAILNGQPLPNEM